MKTSERAFTVLELLAVLAILAVLASLPMPALSPAKSNMKRATCLNNLAQIGKGVAMYADDFNQVLFPIANKPEFENAIAVHEWTAYNPLMRSYVGLRSAPSLKDKLFTCPADTFDYWPTNGSSDQVGPGLHFQSKLNFASYGFNAGNAVFRNERQFDGMFPGVMGCKLGAIRLPAKTVLLTEFAALDGYSWHVPPPRGERHYNNAPNVLSFADGHVAYTRMYSGSNNASHRFQFPFAFNPPAGYDYKWTAD